jgi:uncharacterized BrkB/YihY/UPF0761 family membrane protein
LPTIRPAAVAGSFYPAAAAELHREIGELLGDVENAVYSWLDDRAPTIGAAIAFYAMFSLAPMLALSRCASKS